MLAWTIPIVKLLKTSYVMRSRPSKNNAEFPCDPVASEEVSACETMPVSEMKRHLRIYPVSRIANGLSENLKNIRKHRSLIQEEINDILGRLMFFTEGRSMAANLTNTKKAGRN